MVTLGIIKIIITVLLKLHGIIKITLHVIVFSLSTWGSLLVPVLSVFIYCDLNVCIIIDNYLGELPWFHSEKSAILVSKINIHNGNAVHFSTMVLQA